MKDVIIYQFYVTVESPSEEEYEEERYEKWLENYAEDLRTDITNYIEGQDNVCYVDYDDFQIDN